MNKLRLTIKLKEAASLSDVSETTVFVTTKQLAERYVNLDDYDILSIDRYVATDIVGTELYEGDIVERQLSARCRHRVRGVIRYSVEEAAFIICDDAKKKSWFLFSLGNKT